MLNDLEVLVQEFNAIADLMETNLPCNIIFRPCNNACIYEDRYCVFNNFKLYRRDLKDIQPDYFAEFYRFYKEIMIDILDDMIKISKSKEEIAKLKHYKSAVHRKGNTYVNRRIAAVRYVYIRLPSEYKYSLNRKFSIKELFQIIVRNECNLNATMEFLTNNEER